MRFLFLSRHTPTKSQIEICEKIGITLDHVGDIDAFNVTPGELLALHGSADGVVVVHPIAAMRLCTCYTIGVFNNINRAPIGSPPDFETTELHMYDVRGGSITGFVSTMECPGAYVNWATDGSRIYDLDEIDAMMAQ